jgi:ubiquinone/menaquinone biosynthesis C-methylase UbiE
MTTDYNQIAGQYQRSKQQTWRSRIESYSLMRLIGDVHGKQVVDVACGEGHFTRKLREAGAERVLGIDISQQMIELASAQEARQPSGIEYRVEDALARVPPGSFDLAVSAWLLVYARNRAELSAMCHGLARRLRPGGRYVTITTNPELYAFALPDYRKYGFEIRLADHVFEGAPIVFTVLLDDSSFEIENYYLPVSAYEEAFHAAGFREFRVHPLELAPHPEGVDDREFWADFLRCPPAILIDCVKA